MCDVWWHPYPGRPNLGGSPAPSAMPCDGIAVCKVALGAQGWLAATAGAERDPGAARPAAIAGRVACRHREWRS
ncbi:hypothetical protein Scani_40420 [Streptomyces caniferus]|uniref:Uncharacterized protein n=1 Tax=Streptomyces caniferus TaxID=285557 RepID=A0A640SAB7_9ACTN|nr:hypothetical protein Scani_40420 [Streptomyces caniferus]